MVDIIIILLIIGAILELADFILYWEFFISTVSA